MTYIEQLGQNAKTVSTVLRTSSGRQRNSALMEIARVLRDETAKLIEENQKDLVYAKKNGISDAMLDRLALDEKRIEDIALAVEQVAAYADPVGIIESGTTRPNGMQILKTKVPMGVIAMIYEARPNVTVDAAALCLKSGNACILRGGKEAINSNKMLVDLMRKAVLKAGLPMDAIALVEDTARETTQELMRLSMYVDLLVPRGGPSLIQSVVKNATVPVIETGVGNCHIFVDESADIDMAVRVVDNAKTSRPAVCNAVETVLVHKEIAQNFLPQMQRVLDIHKVELRGCSQTQAILPNIKSAIEEDYYTEYDDYILAVKVVDDLDEAVAHIAKYGSGHSDAIITNDYRQSQRFILHVDSAAVYVNCSTRFTDGGEFGLGAEIGISTQKLHARGPMGLDELTTTKYIVMGNGQIR